MYLCNPLYTPSGPGALQQLLSDRSLGFGRTLVNTGAGKTFLGSFMPFRITVHCNLEARRRLLREGKRKKIKIPFVYLTELD